MKFLRNPYVIIILLGIIVYANTFPNEFLWDDEHFIIKNRYIKDIRYLPNIFKEDMGAGAYLRNNFYRPLQLIMYMIVFKFFKLNPVGYHLLNLVLHIFNALLLYMVITKLFNTKIAFLTTTLFIVHPIHTEAVTYMSGTADPLSVFFCLVSLILYLKRKLYLSVIFFTLGLLSKETVIIFPFLVMITDMYRHKKNFMRILPFFVVSFVYFLMRLTILNFVNILNFYNEDNIYTTHISYRLFTFLKALLVYYRLLLIPLGLHMERTLPISVSLFEPLVFFSFLVLIALIVLCLDSFKKERVVFFSVSWFFISLLPMSGIIPVNAILLEHWLYLPSIGFFVIVAFFLTKANNRLLYTLFIIIIIIFSIITILRNRDWRDPITFYTKTLKYAPHSARVHNNLAMAYADKGLYEQAIKEYLLAIKISDNYAETHHNLANLYLELGQIEEAIKEYKRAIELNNNFVYAHQALANLYYHLGNYSEAKKEMEIVQRLINKG